MNAGTRIGNWFLWLDVDTVSVDHEKTVVVSARRAVMNGDVLAREFASREMAKNLRTVADKIDKALGDIEQAPESNGHDATADPEGVAL